MGPSAIHRHHHPAFSAEDSRTNEIRHDHAHPGSGSSRIRHDHVHPGSGSSRIQQELLGPSPSKRYPHGPGPGSGSRSYSYGLLLEFRQLMLLALPAMLQQLAQQGMIATDQIFLGHLGTGVVCVWGGG